MAEMMGYQCTLAQKVAAKPAEVVLRQGIHDNRTEYSYCVGE